MAGGQSPEASAGVADQAGGDVQQVAQGVGGGLGQFLVVVEGEQPQQGDFKVVWLTGLWELWLVGDAARVSTGLREQRSGPTRVPLRAG
jgi:hypothetical protein